MIRLGDVKITRIEESVVHEQTNLFADWSAAVLERHRDLLVPAYFDAAANQFLVSIHAWLLQTPARTILIDTCGGNGKDRPASPRFHRLDTPFLERLETAGVRPADVDTVICTHLHVDHVGWNTRLVGSRWLPTFPNAKYVFPRMEVEWRDPKRGARDRPPATHLPFLDSVFPVLEAGMATLVEGNEQLTDEIDLVPTPGHAPGQMAVRVRSGGAEAMFVADVTHLPLQAHYPAWSTKYCEDKELATRTRMRLFEYCADRRVLMLPGHYNCLHGGYLERNGGGFSFIPAEPAS